jgi:hypothetical protein
MPDRDQTKRTTLKGGGVGMPLPITRDGTRVLTVARDIFGSPMLFSMPQAVRDALAAGVPSHSRLGHP